MWYGLAPGCSYISIGFVFNVPKVPSNRNLYVCFLPPVSIPLPNYEMMGLQPHAGDITELGSVHPPSTLSIPLRRICMSVTRLDKQRT